MVASNAAVNWAKSHVNAQTQYATNSKGRETKPPIGFIKRTDCSGLISCALEAAGIYSKVWGGAVNPSTPYYLNAMPRLKPMKGYITPAGRSTARGAVLRNWNKDSESERNAMVSWMSPFTLLAGDLLLRYDANGPRPGHIAFVSGWSGNNVILMHAMGAESTPEVGLNSQPEAKVASNFHVVFRPAYSTF